MFDPERADPGAGSSSPFPKSGRGAGDDGLGRRDLGWPEVACSAARDRPGPV